MKRFIIVISILVLPAICFAWAGTRKTPAGAFQISTDILDRTWTIDAEYPPRWIWLNDGDKTIVYEPVREESW